MSIQHKKKYGVYHWDTFDNKTMLIEEFNTLVNAKAFVAVHYAGRISSSGADQVDIVDDSGHVIRTYKIK